MHGQRRGGVECNIELVKESKLAAEDFSSVSQKTRAEADSSPVNSDSLKMVHSSWAGVAATVVLFLALGVEQGMALKCWTCSSQTSANCHDHFNQTEDRLGQVRLQDCDNDRIHSSYSSYSTAVCKKQRQRVSGGEVITLRHCDWVTEHSNERRENGNCIGSSTAPTYIKVEYCETCTQDGCNGSPKDMLAPVWSTLVPIIMYFGYKSSM